MSDAPECECTRSRTYVCECESEKWRAAELEKFKRYTQIVAACENLYTDYEFLKKRH